MKILGIGEIVWDCLPGCRKLGGAPVNFSFYAKELGAESYPVSAVGNDSLGDEAIEACRTYGLRTDCICWGSLAQSSEITRNTIKHILKAAPSDCLKVFDINIRQHYYSREIVLESMRMADVLKLNEEELPVVLQLTGDSFTAAFVTALLGGCDVRTCHRQGC